MYPTNTIYAVVTVGRELTNFIFSAGVWEYWTYWIVLADVRTAFSIWVVADGRTFEKNWLVVDRIWEKSLYWFFVELDGIAFS